MGSKLTVGRGAIATACDLLGYIRTNAELEGVLIEYGISDYVRPSGSIAKTILNLKEFAVKNPGHQFSTDFGIKPLGILLAEEVIRRVEQSSKTEKLWEKLERYLNLDGYSLLRGTTSTWGAVTLEITGLTVAMPQFAELPESSNEVEILIDRHGFHIAERHLSSAKENITQGDWEAANSQCRTFLEALTDAIAERLYPTESCSRSSGLQKRQLLADRGFLSREKHEFGDGHGQTFLPGLAKLLHPDGAHPGISTQHDAIFRLQLVLVTARWLLKRLENSTGGIT
ncbi:hypothetical protein ACQQ2Q_17920 [Agrobacterium sp. ES01]|uniref:hypothetical protein n=1 Tax=Agrobacterium sp. ES01 TaxID=3420714 RepID=UPI003D0E2744